jgi:hypothetical protein
MLVQEAPIVSEPGNLGPENAFRVSEDVIVWQNMVGNRNVEQLTLRC